MKLNLQKPYVTKIQEKKLAYCRDGREGHGFVLVQEAILKDGNLYTGKKLKFAIMQ